MSRGGGALMTVHRIFMVTALVCALGWAGWEVRRHGRDGLPGAVLGVAVAVGIVLYLRKLGTRGARLAPPEEEDAERRHR